MKITVGTAVVTLLVALDGDGASTFLITVSAFLPIYKRIGMRPLVLTGVVALAAGVMNMIPWGGPTVRAMAALEPVQRRLFIPVLPAMGAGIAWVLLGRVPDRPPRTVQDRRLRHRASPRRRDLPSAKPRRPAREPCTRTTSRRGGG